MAVDLKGIAEVQVDCAKAHIRAFGGWQAMACFRGPRSADWDLAVVLPTESHAAARDVVKRMSGRAVMVMLAVVLTRKDNKDQQSLVVTLDSIYGRCTAEVPIAVTGSEVRFGPTQWHEASKTQGWMFERLIGEAALN